MINGRQHDRVAFGEYETREFQIKLRENTLNHNLRWNKVVNTNNGLCDYFPLAKPVLSSKQAKWETSYSFSQPSGLF